MDTEVNDATTTPLPAQRFALPRQPLPRPPLPRQPLARPRDCVLGGVSVGLARHLCWPVAVVRLLFVVLSFVSGVGILLYLWLWALTPLDPHVDTDCSAGSDDIAGAAVNRGAANRGAANRGAANRGAGGRGAGGRGVAGPAEAVHRGVPVAWLLFAVSVSLALLVLVLGRLFGDTVASGLAPAVFGMVAGAVGGVAWDQLIDIRTGADAGSSRIRIAAGSLLVAVAVLEPFAWHDLGAPLAWPLFSITLLAGAAVLLGPWALRLWRELIAERTKRVREEQRAEIAAHLHDSVLQTLALIQNRAGASTEVARIARAQERELREWLYAGSAPVDSDLATDLRDFAAALELDYPARIEVVTVGDPIERASGEMAAAAREAMLNAARHAGGEVSVYLETTQSAVDVFVRDRGPGFDPSAVPQGRLGVRESILGRMRRAAGSAQVNPGAGGEGTEIHLHLDRQADRAATEGEQQ